MKKLLLTAIFALSVWGASAQNFKASDFKSTAKTEQVKEETTYTYTDNKGETYKVYKSKNGAFFILRTSKKTGKEYRYYLPKDVQIAMGRKYDDKK